MTGRIIINGELGPIGDEKGVQLVDVIQQVKKQPDATAFEVFINSPGGNVDTGWKIYDYLKGLKKPLTTIGQGIVASMATVVFMAGDRRKVYDNTIFMVHSPRLQVTQGTAEDLQWQASEMAKVEKKMADFYAKHFDVDIDTIKTLMRDETFLTRQQLADFGITTTEPLKAVAKLYLNEKPSEMKNQTKKKSVIAQIKALLGGVEDAVAKLVYTADMRTLDFTELEEDDTISVGDTAVYSDDGTAPEGEVILDDGRVLTFEAGEVINIEEPADDDDAPTVEELQEEIEVLQAENRKLARAQAKLNEKLASAKKDALNKKKILEKLALLETDVDGDEPVRRPQPRGKENKRGSRASAALANLKKRK